MSYSNDISNNSGPGSAAEPSMEEILASIRRILKEDDASQVVAEAFDEDDDVLVLDDSMIATPADISTATALPAEPETIAAPEPTPEPVHFVSEPAIDSHVPEEALPEPETEPEIYAAPEAAPEPEPAPPQTEMEPTMEEHVQSPEGLVGDDASHAIASTIGSLITSISADRSVAVSRGGITIEDIVRDEIRPVLKAWLDTNLPSLVERIVRAEIGRVIDRSQV